MPEWKSWTFNGDEDAVFALSTPSSRMSAIGESARSNSPGAGDAAATEPMAPDAVAAKWGTEVSPVTIERIEAVMAGDGLPHVSSQFLVLTEIEGLRIQVHREPADAPWVQVECRLDLPESSRVFSRDTLNAHANTWNVEHLQPTVFPVETESGPAFVLATRFFVEEGMSDRQIHAMIRRGLTVTVQAARQLPELFSGD